MWLQKRFVCWYSSSRNWSALVLYAAVWGILSSQILCCCKWHFKNNHPRSHCRNKSESSRESVAGMGNSEGGRGLVLLPSGCVTGASVEKCVTPPYWLCHLWEFNFLFSQILGVFSLVREPRNWKCSHGPNTDHVFLTPTVSASRSVSFGCIEPVRLHLKHRVESKSISIVFKW